jgi:hypothetical protein
MPIFIVLLKFDNWKNDNENIGSASLAETLKYLSFLQIVDL